VPGLHQLFGPARGSARIRIVCVRSLGADARRDPSAASTLTVKSVRCDSRFWPTIGPRARRFELGFKAGHANDATAVADHHAMAWGVNLGSRHDQIAFIFPIRVVRHITSRPAAISSMADSTGSNGGFDGVVDTGRAGTIRGKNATDSFAKSPAVNAGSYW